MDGVVRKLSLDLKECSGECPYRWSKNRDDTKPFCTHPKGGFWIYSSKCSLSYKANKEQIKATEKCILK